MSASYRMVQWNRHKTVYDAVLIVSVVFYIATFFVISKITWPPPNQMSDEIIMIRALGTAAILLLHLILCIGPLSRLNRRFLVLLYNRRHLGVTMFFLALAHGALATIWYHGFGNANPLISIFTANTRYDSLTGFPFQTLGVAALLILFFMAATSHDFWLHNLSPRTWKSLHMLVYIAYGLVVMHVTLGFLQDAVSPWYAMAMGMGLLLIISLHLITGLREWRRDHTKRIVAPPSDANDHSPPWVDLCEVDVLTEDHGHVITLQGHERIAVFRHDGKVAAMSNVCAHQQGPLGEGRIVDGCVTCPWHGYQFSPDTGVSPPPFDDHVPTYPVRIVDGQVQVQLTACTRDAPATPVAIEEVGS